MRQCNSPVDNKRIGKVNHWQEKGTSNNLDNLNNFCRSDIPLTGALYNPVVDLPQRKRYEPRVLQSR